jgi:hypothetical protein
MQSVFAVIPDQTSKAAAFFDDLEDAMEWALSQFGSDAFRIRSVALAELGPEHGGPLRS